MGQIGISAEELGRLTPRRLVNLFNGWEEKENMQRAYDRLNTFYIVASNGAKKIKKPKDLYEIVGIDNQMQEVFSEDELDHLLDKWGRTLPGATVMNKKELLKLRQTKN